MKENTEHILTTINQIDLVESKMLSMPQVECSVAHHFGPGVYMRQVSIPADTFSIGHHQNTEHLNHMIKGRVIMLNDDGTTSELIAPVIYTAKPGRKIGYIVEDMVWINIYATEETDIDILEKTYLTKSDFWVNDNKEKMNIEYLSRHNDRKDFKKMLKDLGVSGDLVETQSKNEEDRINISNIKIKVSESSIEGKGLFALTPFKAGELISNARINGKRTQAGRYTNHSIDPNAIMQEQGKDINLVAIKDINGCFGGNLGEEITVDYRQAFKLTKKIGDICLQLQQQ